MVVLFFDNSFNKVSFCEKFNMAFLVSTVQPENARSLINSPIGVCCFLVQKHSVWVFVIKILF